MKKFLKEIYATLKRWHILSWQQFKEIKQARLERKEYLKLIGDWYYQHSWFERKWFLRKLKRIIMNFVYKFTDKIDDEFFDYTCEKYFTHYRFFTNDNKIIAELPLIIYCKNIDEYNFVIGEISQQLSTVLLYKITRLVDPELISGVNIQNRITELENKYSGNDSAIVKIVTRTENELNSFDYVNSQSVDLTIIKTNGKEKYIEPNTELKIYVIDRK